MVIALRLPSFELSPVGVTSATQYVVNASKRLGSPIKVWLHSTLFPKSLKTMEEPEDWPEVTRQ
jgi:hypothetical protein